MSFSRTALRCSAFLVAVIGSAVMVAPAWAVGMPQAYPPPAVGLQLSTSITTRGSTIQVTGEGCAAGSMVTITLTNPNSTAVELGTTVANGQGSFTTSVTIPLNTSFDDHQVVATCQALALSALLTVVPSTPAQPTSSHRPLPLTGVNTRAPLLASLALIVLGSATVLVARKRRNR